MSEKSLLEKLKDLLSLSRFRRPASESEPTPRRQSSVTVEREPAEDADVESASEEESASTTPSEKEEEEASAETVSDEESARKTPSTTADTAPVDDIKGIGPTYAERLEAAGISTVDDLAASDAGTVSEAADASETRATEWIERAQNR